MIENPFGQKLKEYREGYPISQSKLAERAGFDHSYVSRLESGARVPTVGAVHRLAEALQLPKDKADRLRAAAGFMPSDPSSLFANPDLARLSAVIPRLPLPVQEDVRAVIRMALRVAVAEGVA